MEQKQVSKPFVLFRTKQELMRSEEQKQMQFERSVKEELSNPKYKLTDVFGATTLTLNSPPKVIEVKLINSPSVFSRLAF